MLFLTVVWFVCIIRFAMFDSVSSDGHHRVRRFAMTKNSKLSFDFNFLMPVPVMGSMDVLGIIEVPVSVAVTNDTFDWTPISLPYFVMSAPPPTLPLPMFPKVFHDPEEAVKYLSHHSHYVHQVVKRHTRRISFQHRKDILTTIIDSLEEFGLDGGSCIHRYICQLAHSPLLIESSFHEIIHHIFSFSGEVTDDEGQSFWQAHDSGRRKTNCLQLYPGCPLDLFFLHEEDEDTEHVEDNEIVEHERDSLNIPGK